MFRMPIVMLCCLATATFAKTTYDLDKEIAMYASILATNALAKDHRDEKALQLLKFAEAIDANGPDVIMARVMLDKGKFRTKPTKVDEAKLLKVICARNQTLFGKLKYNSAMIDLCELYTMFLMGHEKTCSDPKTILVYMNLRVRGHSDELDTCLGRKLDLKGIFRCRERPEKWNRTRKMSKTERTISIASRELGMAMLSKDAKSKKGLILLQLSGLFEPTQKDYLLAMYHLERNEQVTAVPPRGSLKAFLSILKKSALELIESKDEKEVLQGFMYLKILERFTDMDQEILVPIAQLERKGFEGDLNDLLFNGKGLPAQEEKKEKEVLGWREQDPVEETAAADDSKVSMKLADVYEALSLGDKGFTLTKNSIYAPDIENHSKPILCERQLRFTGKCKFSLKVRGRWYHTAMLVIGGKEFIISVGHWANNGTRIIVGAEEVKYKGDGYKIPRDKQDEWREVKITVSNGKVTFYYDGRKVHEAEANIPKSAKLQWGICPYREAIEFKDFSLKLK